MDKATPMQAHQAGSGTKDAAARRAGGLLLLTALLTIFMVVGRVAADADRSALLESLDAIASNRGFYLLSGASRALSGLTLLFAAVYLARTWIIKERYGTPLVPSLLGASGAFTALSGGLAVALTNLATGLVRSGSLSLESADTVSDLRRLTGNIGFALAGLALIVAARYQWKVGGALRFIAPVSAIIGVAMQFIWINAATFAHPIIGAGFFVWLVAVGTMLATGRTEKLFARMVAQGP